MSIARSHIRNAHADLEDQPAPPPGGGGASIGDILRQLNNLAPEQIEQILAHQRERGLRFGEAAVALGLAKRDDVVWALSQQFHYPYAPEGRERFSEELVVATQPFTEQAEAFRAMRTQLLMRAFGDEPRRALSVISPEAGDGKTYFAANMAVAFSQLGGRTVLVDANMRSPRVHEVFGLKNGDVGLSSILAGRVVSNPVQVIKELPSLYVLPVGTVPPNPQELVERPAFALLIRELLTKFEHVIVDTPAVTAGADGVAIAARCGNAVAVARQNRSRMNSLHDMLGAINVGPTRLCGVVMNEF